MRGNHIAVCSEDFYRIFSVEILRQKVQVGGISLKNITDMVGLYVDCLVYGRSCIFFRCTDDTEKHHGEHY